MNDLRISWQPSLEFPAGSKTNYLYLAAPMFGCIKDTDTLVSTAFCALTGFINEFNAFERFTEREMSLGSAHYNPEAVADQEYLCQYSDTGVSSVPGLINWLDGIDYRIHKPIGVEISQISRAWSGGLARRFIIIDLWIKNISQSWLERPTIGLTIVPSAGNYDNRAATPYTEMTGYMMDIPLGDDAPPESIDTLNVLWYADGDGQPNPGFRSFSPTAAVGYRVLRSPNGPINFNWWGALESHEVTWGPLKDENRADYTAKFAWPYGDKSLYQLMTNGETDYDNMYAAQNHADSGWAPPHSDPYLARSLAAGQSSLYMHLSCGPFADMAPGDSVPFTYAIVVGEDLHTRPDNYAVNFDPRDPSSYRENLNFAALINTARAADWYYDNPGVDTDGNGYRGKFYLINCTGTRLVRCDTVWYKGDGVPDWSGLSGPPSPLLDLTSQPHHITLRWTGAVSETNFDQLAGRRDFEGYRVYSSRLNTVGAYALISSWDIPDDFYRLTYNPSAGNWKQVSYPQTVAQWQRELGDPEFDPADYSNPSLTYAYRDIVIDTIRDVSGAILRIEERERLSYWAEQGPNQGNTFPDGGVMYDNYIQRVAVVDTVIGEDTLQYGVYEFNLENLSAAVPLWFTVTAFDHGDYRRNVDPLEGGVGANAMFAFPLHSADVVVDSGLKVAVYPNPYKIEYKDALGNRTNYYAQGFEAYGKPRMDERERRIWFANLPDTANIRIYSLDGDLIRDIHHPDKFLTRYSSVVGWDLISRNTQAVTSGIYIWRVDSRLGSQVGKIVIIK